MSDEEHAPHIEIAQGYLYWAPLREPGRIRSRWERLRLWLWSKRWIGRRWVPIGATAPHDSDSEGQETW